MDSSQLKSYFNFNQTNNPDNDTAAVLGIEGRSYPTTIYYLKGIINKYIHLSSLNMQPVFVEPTPNYIDESINTVLKIQQSTTSGDILVFLTGKEEIMQAVNTLDDYSTKTTNEK